MRLAHCVARHSGQENGGVMPSTRFTIPVLVLVSFVTLQADDARRDGNWWREQSQATKANYMIGFFDGMDLGKYFSYWGLPPKSGTGLVDPKVDPAAQVIVSYDGLVTRFMSHVTNLQVSDGLDMFYSDYRNRTIRIHSAVWVVLNMIAGKPEKEIQDLIEGSRRSADIE
jgi:hypothetical protein